MGDTASQANFSPSKAFNAAHPPIDADTLEKVLVESQIKANEDINLPPVCIELLKNGISSTIGTLGNISLAIGRAKQGKSFLVSMLLAAAVSGELIDDSIKVSLPINQRNILHFDTEQSRYHVNKGYKRIYKKINSNPSGNFSMHNLRKYTPEERLQAIEFAIYNSPNVGLVIIDGIRDLIISINSEEESCYIASKLLKWSEERNVHILCVLHMNKGKTDETARGHIGAELSNKSESVIGISKSNDEQDTVIVEPLLCRDRDFDPFAFKIDGDGIPHILTNWFPKEQNAKNQSNILLPNNVSRAVHLDILKDALKTNKQPKLNEVTLSLQNVLNERNNLKVPKSTVDSYLQYYIDEKLIFKYGRRPHTQYRLDQPILDSTTE